jgi:phosphatidylserine/phosphatidylglycerophosphate/cardiolipin synthase-like enzyme
MPAPKTSSSGCSSALRFILAVTVVLLLILVGAILTSNGPWPWATQPTLTPPQARTITPVPPSETPPAKAPTATPVKAPTVAPAKPPTVTPVKAPTATPIAGMPGWLKVYFTNPNPPDDTQNGIDRIVVSALNSAKQTIDVTSFDLNLPSVVNALVEASQRGVKVRVVVDEENGTQDLEAKLSPGNKAFKALSVFKAAKIPVVDGGRTNGLMHDKMIIVDGQTLFMGSWNMSYNDTFRNNNNLLQITDPLLIANYQAKFNDLYVNKHFGAHAELGAQKQSLTIDGVQVENYFSPADEVMQKLVQYVKGSRKSIRFMAFTYTHPDLVDAMIARTKAGVNVQGVIESRGASQGALVPLFVAKLPVKVDGNKYTMHHKVIIIDNSIVVTGSFNFTETADTANDDNVLVIHSPVVAALYLQEFERVNSIAQTPSASDAEWR